MNKLIQKIVSLALLFLISLLVLDYFKIIEFNNVLGSSLSFITIVLIVFSSTSVICTSKSGLNKFINYLILTSITVGIVFRIIYGKLNMVIYVALLLTVVYALMDMLYKRPD
ncbi:MAG: hypothetical protein KIC66_03815 [Clostridium sp.]|uniref:Uncharacterized protein n=1 Tax=Clostridium paraputrificum TaxID=29363 RepID=A0A6N3E381_9CLOT|nr:hypothetical protein [Clostridium sp.]MBS5926200.1 hypothetical protein [Clostridium sp.]MBS5987104.1 hypothetical protein [Clostridium sp.]